MSLNGGDNMRKNYEEFFLGLSEVDFLTMKLLHSVFKKFEQDDVSCRITDNLDVLSCWDIRLIKSEESFSYIDFYDNSKREEKLLTLWFINIMLITMLIHY